MTPQTVDLSTVLVVVVNYGSCHLLAENLVTVSRACPEARIVVVDNLTTQAERARVTALCDEHAWTALLPGENLGFGAACNRAVSSEGGAGVTHVLLLNPDATIDRDSLLRLQTRAGDGRSCMVAPVVRSPTGTVWSAGTDVYLEAGDMHAWRRRPEHSGESQPWLTGACLLVSLDLWRLLDGFDEDYFLYWEDVDLSRRALALGADLVVEEGATAIHDAGGTQRGPGSTGKSAVYYYYNTRNRLLFAAKHLDVASQARWRRTAPLAGYRILLRGGRRRLLNPGTTVVPALRGTWAGVVMMRERRRPGLEDRG